VNIEPIVEEDGEESKYAPTPQKPVTSKMSGSRAVECIKNLRNKELEKRLEIEENNIKMKNFKSADAQKQKATIKDPQNLPPKPPTHLKNYNNKIPSSTKASSKGGIQKSFTSVKPGQTKQIKNSVNESQNSSENGKINPES